MPYYAVKKGRKPGVYKSWDACEKQVRGFSGAVYKKFDTYPEAYCFVFEFSLNEKGYGKSIAARREVPNVLLNTQEDVIVINPDTEYVELASKIDAEPIKITDFKRWQDKGCKEQNTISLYTDGACSGNPGKGGYGYAVVINNILTLKGSGGLLCTTNNQMELTAVIEGLKVVPQNYPVVVYSDSAYVVNAFKKNWISNWQKHNWIRSGGVPVANRELWEELLALFNKFPAVKFVWVKGHADNKYNELCDRLAVDAIRHVK